MNTKAKSNHETLLQAILIEFQRMNTTLDIIAESLVNSHGNGPSAGPNFQRALPDYPTFDWEAIGAEIVKWDRHGATVVKWQGLEFFRRRHTDYDASIWFSRYTGQKDDSDRKIYARLITFSDRPNIVKGLPDEVTDRLPESSPPPQEQPADQESASDDRQPTSSQPTSNPRTELYQLIPQLVRAGKLSAEGANQLANYAKEEGYAAALKAARDLANRDAAPQPAKQAQSQSQPKSQPKQKPKAQPTAAELLYPKNELDDFFPRE